VPIGLGLGDQRLFRQDVPVSFHSEISSVCFNRVVLFRVGIIPCVDVVRPTDYSEQHQSFYFVMRAKSGRLSNRGMFPTILL
jgi:hypothetical protein